MSNNSTFGLENIRIPNSVKLALMWASLMFLYLYNDYFSLYTHGTIEEMAAGRIGPLGEATRFVLVGVSIMVAIPALMIFLSVAFPPALSRWLNVGLGLAYTIIEGLTLFGAPLFYRIVVVLEIALTASIVWYSLRWPRTVVAD